MPKNKSKNKIPKEFENLERQLKRTLKILTGFVITVLALALFALIYAFYLAK